MLYILMTIFLILDIEDDDMINNSSDEDMPSKKRFKYTRM